MASLFALKYILGLLDQRFMHRWNRLNNFAYLLAMIFSMDIFLEFCCCECALPTILGISVILMKISAVQTKGGYMPQLN
ncbi:hypothetical protein ACJX0J_005306, partial [Zea mays]